MHGQLIHSPWCEAPKDVPIAQSGSSQPLESAPVPVLGEAVAEVDEDDTGLFVDILPGSDGCPVKRGDKLYLAPAEHITRAELEALRRDAERYRWLRNEAFSQSDNTANDAAYLFLSHGDDFDAQVDSAMQEKK